MWLLEQAGSGRSMPHPPTNRPELARPPQNKKLAFSEFFQPEKFVRSTSIGGLIMARGRACLSLRGCLHRLQRFVMVRRADFSDV